MIGAALLVAVALSQPVQEGAVGRAADREWQVRAWALAPAVSDDLRTALTSESWRERDLALDALVRSFDAAVLRADAVADLLPGVQARAANSDAPDLARAVTALARWPGPVRVSNVAALAEHPLPAVRIALAEWLAVSSGPANTTTLAHLLRDPDERVARVALRSWAAGASAASDWSLVPTASLSELLRCLERIGTPDAALVSLAAFVDGDPWAACRVEALRLRLHGSGDVAVLALGWRAAEDTYTRGLMQRAAEVASLRAPALGDALFDRYRAQDAELPDLLRSVVLASDPMRLLARVAEFRALDPRLQAGPQVWLLLIGRDVHWDEEVVGPWLAEPDAELRLAVVKTLSIEDAAQSDGALGRLLVRALDDPSPRIAGIAFRALADARDPGPWLPALHASWLELEPEARARFLDYLPRGVPVRPFRDDLLELVRAPAPALTVLALIASLGPDAELAGVVGELLDAQLDAHLNAPRAQPDPDRERACVALLRAWVPLAGEELPAQLDGVLARTAQVSEPLAKLTAATLGHTPQGRAVLERHVSSGELPDRILIEASLALAAAGGDERFMQLLAERYDACDRELRARVIEVARVRAGATSLALLRRIALDAGDGADELRDAACWALVPRAAPAFEVLASLIEARAPVELRAVAIRALGEVEDPRARPFLLARLRELEHAGAPDELVLFERAALLETVARVQPAPDWLVASWLERPRDEARADLTARFVGERLPATEFRWRTELTFAAAAAAEGQLAAALASSGDWARIDGRCLAALGRVALASGDARALQPARELLAAALVALAGEGPAADLDAARLQVRKSAWLAAERAEDWPAVRLHAQRLVDLRLREQVSEMLWVAEFGEFDPVVGRDLEARLHRSLQHAEERIEHARGRR